MERVIASRIVVHPRYGVFLSQFFTSRLSAPEYAYGPSSVSYTHLNMPCAGKTGTTNDNIDGWFVGYTAYYTTGVWVGFDSPRSTHSLSGATYPLDIWYNYMTELHKDRSARNLND